MKRRRDGIAKNVTMPPARRPEQSRDVVAESRKTRSNHTLRWLDASRQTGAALRKVSSGLPQWRRNLRHAIHHEMSAGREDGILRHAPVQARRITGER